MLTYLDIHRLDGSPTLEQVAQVHAADMAGQSQHLAYPLRVRARATVGGRVARNKDIFGATSQLVSRRCAQAAPGEVPLKGFDQPTRIHRVV